MMASPGLHEAVQATVIIPTFGEAKFARWAVESVRDQTVRNIEICIICDGSPPAMVSFFNDIAKQDGRIKVFSYPKSERHGEPYRDKVIKEATQGVNIYYCCHDDLWFPDHIEEIGKYLRHRPFAHSIHTAVGLADNGSNDMGLFSAAYRDLKDHIIRERMLNINKPTNYFGLSFGAHTRKAYFQLEEGWATTPQGIWTDLHMWRKFLVKYGGACGTCKKISALHFQAGPRSSWSADERDEELSSYYKQIQDPEQMKRIRRKVINNIPQFRNNLVYWLMNR